MARAEVIGALKMGGPPKVMHEKRSLALLSIGSGCLLVDFFAEKHYQEVIHWSLFVRK